MSHTIQQMNNRVSVSVCTNLVFRFSTFSKIFLSGIPTKPAVLNHFAHINEFCWKFTQNKPQEDGILITIRFDDLSARECEQENWAEGLDRMFCNQQTEKQV